MRRVAGRLLLQVCRCGVLVVLGLVVLTAPAWVVICLLRTGASLHVDRGGITIDVPRHAKK